jgi:hypothetical protein
VSAEHKSRLILHGINYSLSASAKQLFRLSPPQGDLDEKNIQLKGLSDVQPTLHIKRKMRNHRMIYAIYGKQLDLQTVDK